MTASRRARALAPAVLLLAVIAAGCSSAAKLGGTSLNGVQAPDFTLTDATGRQFSLHDFRGRAVVLTFLYTHCPDVCPALAGNLARAAHALGPAVNQAQFLAISVDPEHDTPESAVSFTDDHDLAWLGDGWRYGLGSRPQLTQIWHAYGIGAEPLPAAASAPQLVAAGYSEIDHNAVLYLIDARGRERTLLDPDTTAVQIARDLKAIAGG